MKFELERLPRNKDQENILDELRRVANLLRKQSITTTDLAQHGKVYPHTVIKRFGNWNTALSQAGLLPTKRAKYTDDEVISQIKRVAKLLNKKTLTQEEFDNNSNSLKQAVAVRRFKSWNNALKKAGLDESHYCKLTDEDYFKNLEEMWIKLGRQPKYSEVIKSFSRYSSGAYEYHFGSWGKALLAFIEYKQKAPLSISTRKQRYDNFEKRKIDVRHKTTRNIPPRLWIKVLKRDGFKCVKCGRTPAIVPGTILQVDHIIPYSKGGETILENLQTLCKKCNLGKGNLCL